MGQRLALASRRSLHLMLGASRESHIDIERSSMTNDFSVVGFPTTVTSYIRVRIYDVLARPGGVIAIYEVYRSILTGACTYVYRRRGVGLTVFTR